MSDPHTPYMSDPQPSVESQNDATSASNEENPKPKRKRHRALRIIGKTLMWIVICILLLPVLLYIPPVQDLAIKIASDMVEKSTGMKIGIGQFRLNFPLDVKLKDVYVVEEKGDTMVRASEAIADIKLLPLLKLDIDINRVLLNEGYYRMVSPDSSMILTVNAGHVEIDDKSSVNIKAGPEIILNRTKLRDGKLTLYMDVWKKKETPADSASTPTKFKILANNLDIENFEFGMSMLPTIDTMDVAVKKIMIRDAKVDLGENLVSWRMAKLAEGSFKYLTPTAEYIKTHPAPPSLPSNGPPMRIMGDSIAVDSLSAIYAVRDAKPLPGFDANYIDVTGIGISLKNFYNESSTVKLPLTRLQAKERCGLQIMSGTGTIGIDSIGLTLDKIYIRTLFSTIKANGDVPFAMMALDPQSPMRVNAQGSIGIPDVESFMPAAKSFTSMIPGRKPLQFDIDAKGSLSNLTLRKLETSMQGVLALQAHGFAKNPLDYKRLIAKVDFDGTLSDPTIADKLAGVDFSIPAFTINGTAEANGLTYGADFTLRSDAGDVAAIGKVALTPENYTADVTATGIDVARFAPEIGIGKVSAVIKAEGHGFNPLSGTAVTDAVVDISSIEYNKRNLRDIHLDATIVGTGEFNLIASSPNPGLDFDLEGTGMIQKDDYTFDITARLRDLNIEQLGLTDSLCCGSGDITIKGNAQPEKWIYDVDLALSNFDWNLPGQYYHLPQGINAKLKSDIVQTVFSVNSLDTNVDFTGAGGLEQLISSFTKVGEIVSRQIAERNVVIEEISGEMPDFCLRVNAGGNGLLRQLLSQNGIAIDTVYADIDKDSILQGDIGLHNLSTASFSLDTITMNLKERGALLDYKVHLGNRPGTMDEFARVNLNGYLGNNRVSAFLNQWNIKNEQGYRLGLTAALQDSVLTAHFTPLKSTIAYMPWTFNNDNFIDFNIYNKHMEANLQANSAESSIMAKTQPGKDGTEELNLKIANLHVQDFLQMWAFAPPVKGDLSADLHVNYEDRRFTGAGNVGFKNFVYDNTKVGDFDLDLEAGYGLGTSTDVNAALKINGYPALGAYANLKDSNEGLKPDSIGVSLTRFPLKIANPFLENNVVLGGYLNGDMRMDGSFTAPRLNGEISMDSVTAKIPMVGATLTFGKDPLDVKDNVVIIKDFNIFGANKNPLSINGTVNAKKFNDIIFDLRASASNFQLIKSDKRSKADLYGKVFLNLSADVTGPMKRMNINGNVNLLGTTDATYRLPTAGADFKTETDEGIVKFVNFNDTTQVEQVDTIAESPLNMRIDAKLTISPGSQLEVLLGTNGTDKVEVSPTANLTYFQNYMGDMSLNGVVTIGTGFVRYSIPVIGEKMFNFDPASTITWNGNVMNPILNVTASDEVKANVTSGNNSRLVNFLVTLHATNTLENLGVAFDLSTNDDLAIQNELQSMSADQRQTKAMNLLLYGKYSGQDTKASAASGNILYSYLESTLNSWAAKHVRGVDLTFGVNQYDKITDGASNTETSYSYQVSKSLFNNRFKILVGGNYSTDSADDEIAQNLVSDVSLEYIFKQTQTTNFSGRIFRHIGYESILEGEITEMGAGVVFKRKLENLKQLFNIWRKRKRSSDTPAQRDSVQLPAQIKPETEDSIKDNTLK